MLVVSRYPDEEVVIETSDGLIVVRITSVRGQQVKVGVDAPASVTVHRREVYEAIQREKKQGA